MTTLSVKTAPMANNDRSTLERLLKLGVTQRDHQYELTSAQLMGCGLGANQLLPLLKTQVAAVVDGQGAEVEPKTTVALNVSVFNTGIAHITLGVDLVSE